MFDDDLASASSRLALQTPGASGPPPAVLPSPYGLFGANAPQPGAMSAPSLRPILPAGPRAGALTMRGPLPSAPGLGFAAQAMNPMAMQMLHQRALGGGSGGLSLSPQAMESLLRGYGRTARSSLNGWLGDLARLAGGA
jgi:hypothetical protein